VSFFHLYGRPASRHEGDRVRVTHGAGR
jgi:hypothetical protein